jgi:hypothetical protein
VLRQIGMRSRHDCKGPRQRSNILRAGAPITRAVSDTRARPLPSFQSTLARLTLGKGNLTMTPNQHAIADGEKILEIALSDEDSPAATLARRHWLVTRAGVKTPGRVTHEAFRSRFAAWHNAAGARHLDAVADHDAA